MNCRLFSFLLLTVFLVRPALGLDKARLSDHLRKTYNLTTETEFIIGEVSASKFEGLVLVDVTLKTHRGDQNQSILMSKDEKEYILGSIVDFTVDPDEERWKKINLKGVHFKGASKAPVTIVEYSDLQCNYCQKAHFSLDKELYKAYSKKQVRLVLKQFPLGGHDWAFDGATAAYCAGQQSNEAYWGMVDRFFKEAANISPGNVKDKGVEFAGQLGLNKRQLLRCYDDPKIKKKIEANKKEGFEAGVRSTPSFFVNGRLVKGFRDFKSMRPYIDEKLLSR